MSKVKKKQKHSLDYKDLEFKDAINEWYPIIFVALTTNLRIKLKIKIPLTTGLSFVYIITLYLILQTRLGQTVARELNVALKVQISGAKISQK